MACATVLSAQLVTTTTAIPRTGKPPVVFLNGYQGGCRGPASFEGTFGQFDRVMQSDGRVSLFFDNCTQGPDQPIEQLGATFGRYLDALRYADGQPVPQVDVVMHSMGGLILRSYLSGKQEARGEFRPPAEVKIRKAAFLATPFFGAISTQLVTSNTDVQVEQLRPGSAFLYDLATWNQGIDDLREIDAIAIVANGGSGFASGNGRGSDDSTVSVTSASLDFAMTGRTRVLEYCHTRLSGLLQLGCSVQTPVAAVPDAQHETSRIVLSFFNGTNEWQSIGQSPSDYTRGGLLAEVRDAQDSPVRIESASSGIRIRGERIWAENIAAASPAQISVTRATGTLRTELATIAGSTRVYRLVDNAPNIAAVLPSPSRGMPRVVSPGMFVTIYGSQLATATEQAASQPYPPTLAGTEVSVNGTRLGLHYASPTQVNALMPDNISGLVKLTLRNSLGQQTVNVLVEPSVPTLFGALPTRRGDYVALYLTGLGRTERRADGLDWSLAVPEVTVGGKPCPVLYAGRAPGYAGLDQINCQIAADAATGDTVTASVAVGNRTGTATIPVLP